MELWFSIRDTGQSHEKLWTYDSILEFVRTEVGGLGNVLRVTSHCFKGIPG